MYLGSRLVVEYAKESINTVSDPRTEKASSDKNESGKEYFKEFKKKLNSWNRTVDFHQPPPPHLKYAYPRANVATINNIAHALASVPKFYTQVLHLMNKMNLPPPFSNQPDPPVLQPVEKTEPIGVESESELESEDDGMTGIEENIPNLKRKKVNAPKRAKFIKPSGQAVTKTPTNPAEVFEHSDVSQKKIEMNISSESVDSIKSKASLLLETTGSIRKLPRPPTPLMDEQRLEDTVEETRPVFEKPGVVTIKELIANRISESDFDHIPAFKNYHPGAPTNRIYIKNLAKTVQREDLDYVYKRYLEDSDSTKYEVRLMQEGRMKGQAFITLESMEWAQRAVDETNGYMLKGRPIVAVFAKATAAKKVVEL